MALALIVASSGFAGCGDAGSGATGRAVVPPAPSIVTGKVQPAAAVTGPPPVQRLDPVPPAGSIRFAEGPFSDALSITALRLRRGAEVRATGRLGNRLETNPVLSLVVRADFYDARGRYLATGERSFAGAGREELEPIDEGLRFDIRPDPPAPETATAVVSVPSFVPE